MRAAHVRALRAELEPHFHALFAQRSERPEVEEARVELLASWEHWRELEAAGLSDDNAEAFAGGARLLAAKALRAACRVVTGAAATRTGLTIPTEVTSFHRLWDDYVRGAIAACHQVAARPEGGKPYTYREKALLTGWNAGDDLTAAEELLSGGALLQLYVKTVQIARESLALIKRDFPDVPRPSLPTGVLQAAVIGELEGAGIIAKGSVEIVTDTVDEMGATVSRGLRIATPPLVALAVVGGVVLILSRR